MAALVEKSRGRIHTFLEGLMYLLLEPQPSIYLAFGCGALRFLSCSLNFLNRSVSFVSTFAHTLLA
ncbi:hypothetical protein A2Z22_00785 [Candidatus Woesebacteria bacterium RBG_16_34_12]|uniref:Uncharacterized protein n=1 Tax=Candidatus Woesebacteria bacterium RBG_16_34_12 TaxID=1802480 RepID=A0A1F7X7N1_9BACT|nr:MAG: hypothetical protein A2Z22_00785 [Candidatus Woesebacteria bacterium RBG_16_34_12]